VSNPKRARPRDPRAGDPDVTTEQPRHRKPPGRRRLDVRRRHARRPRLCLVAAPRPANLQNRHLGASVAASPLRRAHGPPLSRHQRPSPFTSSTSEDRLAFRFDVCARVFSYLPRALPTAISRSPRTTPRARTAAGFNAVTYGKRGARAPSRTPDSTPWQLDVHLVTGDASWRCVSLAPPGVRIVAVPAIWRRPASRSDRRTPRRDSSPARHADAGGVARLPFDNVMHFVEAARACVEEASFRRASSRFLDTVSSPIIGARPKLDHGRVDRSRRAYSTNTRRRSTVGDGGAGRSFTRPASAFRRSPGVASCIGAP